MDIQRMIVIAAAAVLAAVTRIAVADGFTGLQAHDICKSEAGADGAKMSSCCADKVLADDAAQGRMQQECMTGVAQPKSAQELEAERKQREDVAAERAARLDREAHGGKATRKGVGIAPKAASAQPTATVEGTGSPVAPGTALTGGAATAAGAAPAASAPSDAAAVVGKAQADCRNSKARTALASLGSIARRFGAKVPSTDCP